MKKISILFAFAVFSSMGCDNFERPVDDDELVLDGDVDSSPAGAPSVSTGGQTSTGGSSNSTGGTTSATGGNVGASCEDGDEVTCPCSNGPGVQDCMNGRFLPCVCPITGTGGGTQGVPLGGSAGMGGSSATGGVVAGAGTTSTGGTSVSTGGFTATGGSSTATGGSSVSTGGSSVSTGGVTTTGGSSTATGGTNSQVCVPSSTLACTCTGSRQGMTTCNSTGTGFLPCSCESVGTGGTGGTSTGGTGGSSEGMDTYRITIRSNVSMPSFQMYSTHYLAFASGDCVSSEGGKVQVCTKRFGTSIATPVFWASTGNSGAGSWLPGTNGTRCDLFSHWTIEKNGSIVPVTCVRNPENTGYNASPVRGSDANDLDGDSVANGSDCAPENASISSQASEVCGNDVDENCDGSTSCTGGTGGTGGSGGSGGTGGNVQTVRFEIPRTHASDDALTIVSPSFTSVGCGSATVINRETGESVAGTFCEISLNTSVSTEFFLKVGGAYATGYTTGTTCNRFFNVYTYIGTSWYARYDAFSSALNGFHSAITEKYVSVNEGCHLVFPPF